MQDSKVSFKVSNLLVCLFLIITTLAVYWQVRDQHFINYDDNIYITENHPVQKGLTGESVRWAFTDTEQVDLWLPLTWLSLMLDYEMYGLDAGGYKLTNLLLHLANTLLLFFLLKMMTGYLWRSAFVAALFALHPLHVESVAWATERKDVLSTLFWMLTLCSYLYYVKQPGIKRYLLILLSFSLGLMAKPMVVTLPLVLLILDYWPLNRLQLPFGNTGEEPPALRPAKILPSVSPAINLVVEKLPLFVLTLVASGVTFIAQRSGSVVSSHAIIAVQDRIANSFISYITYIAQTFWPHSLGVLYPHPMSTTPYWQAAGGALLLVMITVLLIRGHRRHPYLIAGWLWYLITLVPVIGLVQVGVQARADRFTYIPIIGLFIMIAWGVPKLLAGWRYRKTALSIASGVILTAIILLSWFQVQLWESELTLYPHTLSVTGNNYLIQNNLGVALYKDERVDEATLHYSEAIRIKPDYAEAYNNLGLALFANGKVDRAIDHYSEALRLKPDYADAHTNLGIALALREKFAEAIIHYTEALRIEPDHASAHNNLGLALAIQGNISQAAYHFAEALRFKPDYAEAHNNLGKAFEAEENLPEAIDHFILAVELMPDYAEAHTNLGIALAQQEIFTDAEYHFSEAVRLEPENTGSRNNLGIIMELQGKMEEALLQFEECLRLDPSFAEAKYNLDRIQKEFSSATP